MDARVVAVGCDVDHENRTASRSHRDAVRKTGEMYYERRLRAITARWISLVPS